MSSRLLSMKFMQRAAAASSTAPESPQDGPSPKRKKLSDSSRNDSEIASVQLGIAADEVKRDKALQRQAAEAGETRWVLSFKDGLGRNPPDVKTHPSRQVVTASYASIDGLPSKRAVETVEEEQGPRKTSNAGRRSFGRFNRRLEKTQQNAEGATSSEEDDISNSDLESHDEDSDAAEDDASALIRASRKEASQKARADRKAARRAEKATAARLAEARRNKTVKLNKLSSISGTGGGEKNNAANIQCYNCGAKGHIAKDCSARDSKQGKRGDGAPNSNSKNIAKNSR
ncbi:MAG: hypothetical protein M1837_000974 [Sclerophora amabilis]|nr:MAG: hypothetical protein M1837_000974 [Sclerophora amabilis]